MSGADLAMLHVRSLEVFRGLARNRGKCFLSQFLVSVPSPVGHVFWPFCCIDRGAILARAWFSSCLLPLQPPVWRPALRVVLGSGGVGASSLVLQDSLYEDAQPGKQFSSIAGACAHPSSMALADSPSSNPLGGLTQ